MLTREHNCIVTRVETTPAAYQGMVCEKERP